jgi:hypothetical protein
MKAAARLKLAQIHRAERRDALEARVQDLTEAVNADGDDAAMHVARDVANLQAAATAADEENRQALKAARAALKAWQATLA